MQIEIRLDKLKVHYPVEVYEIMQAVLRRENKFDKHKEHFWVLALDYGRTILNLEHISTGSATRTLAEPAEVLSVPLQKGASGLMLVHNHPSGRLEASEADKDLTDMLIQACGLMKVPVLDHIIITENSYMSFEATGLLERLKASNKYKLAYELEKEYHEELEKSIQTLQQDHKRELKATLDKGLKRGLKKGIEQGRTEGLQEGAEQEKVQIAQQLLADGASLAQVQKWTGLALERVEALGKEILK
ncbi:MAG: JAB domain-containing protein [Bacteroidota bacterium]